MVTALVTGGAGFIGSHIVDRLVSEGAAVRVLDNLTTGKVSNLATSMKSGRVKFLKGSITDVKAVRAAARGANTIFHEAALVNVPRSFRNPQVVYRVNTEGTINLLEASRRYDVEHFVYASSSSVYGETGRAPVDEDTPLRPVSPYAASKLAAEESCQVYWRAYGLPTVSLRYFNVYGPRQSGGSYSGVISVFAKAISRNQVPVINGDGSQTRDFVYVEDVVQANLSSAQERHAAGEVFNIGTGRQTSISELAQVMLSLSGHADLQPKHGPPRKGDVRYSCADTARATSRLHYEPKTELAEGVGQVLQWFLTRRRTS